MKKRKHNPANRLTIDERRALMQVKIGRDIEQHGCFVMCVFGEGDQPPFAYSIGLLDTFQVPEVIIFGLQYENMARLINALAHNLRNGKRYEPGQAYDGIAGVPIFFGQVEDQHFDTYLGQAQMHHKRDIFPALQIVWPDTKGVFPWHDGFEERLRKNQPLLFQ
jgi:hypothetical protein